jgi:hypothetical protein
VKTARIKSTSRASRIGERPLSRRVTQTGYADAARQSPFYGSLHQLGRQESQRDRHIDLSNAALVACSNLGDTGDGPGHDLIKPTPATRDGGNESVDSHSSANQNMIAE